MPSVRSLVVKLGEEQWHARRAAGFRGRGWQGCPLVNPLCPDDLCVLPGAHVGTEEGYHLLGTDAWDNPTHLTANSVLFLVEHGASEAELIRRGGLRAQELFPEWFR